MDINLLVSAMQGNGRMRYAIKRCTTSETQQSTTLGMRHVREAYETLKLTSVFVDDEGDSVSCRWSAEQSAEHGVHHDVNININATKTKNLLNAT